MVIPRRRSPFAPINALFIAAPYDCHPSAATGVSIGTAPASGRPARGPYRRLVGARRREIRRPRPPARSRGPPRTRPPTGPPRPAPAAPPGHMPRLGHPPTTSEHPSRAATGPPRSRGWLRDLDPQHRRAHRAREIRTDWPGMHRAFPYGPSLPVRKREPGGRMRGASNPGAAKCAIAAVPRNTPQAPSNPGFPGTFREFRLARYGRRRTGKPAKRPHRTGPFSDPHSQPSTRRAPSTNRPHGRRPELMASYPDFTASRIPPRP